MLLPGAPPRPARRRSCRFLLPQANACCAPPDKVCTPSTRRRPRASHSSECECRATDRRVSAAWTVSAVTSRSRAGRGSRATSWVQGYPAFYWSAGKGRHWYLHRSERCLPHVPSLRVLHSHNMRSAAAESRSVRVAITCLPCFSAVPTCGESLGRPGAPGLVARGHRAPLGSIVRDRLARTPLARGRRRCITPDAHSRSPLSFTVG